MSLKTRHVFLAPSPTSTTIRNTLYSHYIKEVSLQISNYFKGLRVMTSVTIIIIPPTRIYCLKASAWPKERTESRIFLDILSESDVTVASGPQSFPFCTPDSARSRRAATLPPAGMGAICLVTLPQAELRVQLSCECEVTCEARGRCSGSGWSTCSLQKYIKQLMKKRVKHTLLLFLRLLRFKQFWSLIFPQNE